MKERLFDLLNPTRKLKQLLVLFALVLLPMGAWGQTSYELFIGDYEGYDEPTPVGVAVNSSNASNITHDCIKAGTVSFNYDSRTLTLNNATIEGSIYSGGALTINLIGDNYITAADSSAIIGEGSEAALNLTIKGSGSLLAKGTTAYVTDGFNGPIFQDGQSLLLWAGYDADRVYTAVYGSQLFSGGSGTSADNSYIIGNAADLKNLAIYISEDLLDTNGKFFQQDADINCTGLEGFAPIGTSLYPFAGTYNGVSHTISGLTISSNDEIIGLFGRIGLVGADGSKTGYVMNLKLSGCRFAGGNKVGAIVGYLSYGNIDNCTIENCDVISGNGQEVSVGGVAGVFGRGEINNCSVNGGEIKASTTFSRETGSSYAGGIVGYITSDATVDGCIVTDATITSSHANPSAEESEVTAGGIAGTCGEDCNQTIKNCSVKGETAISSIDGSEADKAYAGAIVGIKGDCELESNYYYFPVTTSTKNGTWDAYVKQEYQDRGLGKSVEISNNDYYDIFDNNGVVMYTKKVSLPVNDYGAVYGAENRYYRDGANYETEMYIAPGENTTISVNPSEGYYPESVQLILAKSTINATLESISGDYYNYNFEMPDEDVQISVTYANGTGYPLFVGETQVTSANAEDVLGNSSGVSFMSYIGQNQELVNILTLNNATITAPIKIGLDNLIIDIQGSNTITTSVTCLQKMDNTDPSLTFRSTGDEVGSLILTHNGGVSQIGTVTISRELMPMLTVYGYDDYTSNMYYFTDGSTSVAKFVPSYGVKVGDTQIYSGNADNVMKDEGTPTVVYDAENHILTLNNAHLYNGCISSDLENLTIELIGNNYLQQQGSYATLQSMYGDPVTMTIQSTGETKGCLTMNQPYTREGTFADEHVTLNIVAPLAVVSGSLTGNDTNDNTVLIDEAYGLTVGGVLVSFMNKDKILGDNTVRFNPSTNTLTLYNATIETTGTTPIVTSTLADGLTVELRGTNTLKFAGTGFVSTIASSVVPLTFTTEASDPKPGQLSWADATGTFQEGFNVSYDDPLILQPSGVLISEKPVTIYALTIGTTPVSSVNCLNVLNTLNAEGNATVKYVDEDKTLVLDNATLTNLSIVSGLDKLTIHLIGKSTIIGSQNLISSTDPAAKLTFITNSSEPGTLKLSKNVASGEWISGFASQVIPSDFAETSEGNALTIAHAAPITPIVQDTDDGNAPKAKVPMNTPPAGIDDDNVIINEVIGNVLHTLSSNTDGFDEGSDKGILLNSTVSEDNLLDALKKLPGSQEFAELFKGLTFMIPAGTGTIALQCLIESGYKLAVKIGDDDPIILPNTQYPTVDALADIQLPYTCDVPTYVYIYLPGTAAPARTSGSNREKVLTGNVKVTTVGASSSSIVSTNSYSDLTNTIKDEAKLFVLPAEAVTGDGTGVVLSTIDVSSSGSTNPSRGDRRAAELKPITELAPSVFDGLNKSEIRYVDISGTAIKDFAVNRSSGLMSGFGSNTLIYMPEGNDNGGEDNVIIDGTCASLSLADDNGFRAPKDFKATKAQLQREFTQSQTSTVFLPFALTAAQAEALGTFHTFKEMKGGDAVFNAALTTGTEANTPYIFIPAIDGAKFQADDVEVKLLNKSTATVGNMIGTYEKISWDAEQTDIYGFAAAKTDDNRVKAGQFVRVDDGAWVPPFRAYLKVTSTESRLNIVIDDEITGVKEVNEVSEVNDNSVYSISGQRIQKPTKGMYIINGKKVLVK